MLYSDNMNIFDMYREEAIQWEQDRQEELQYEMSIDDLVVATEEGN